MQNFLDKRPMLDPVYDRALHHMLGRLGRRRDARRADWEPSDKLLLTLLCVAAVLAIMAATLALKPRQGPLSADVIEPRPGSVSISEMSDDDRRRAVVDRNAAIFLEAMRERAEDGDG